LSGARLAAAAALALGLGCAPPGPPAAQLPAKAPAAAAAAPPEGAPLVEACDEDDALRLVRGEVRRVLDRVAELRGLPVRRDVPSRVLDRAAILEQIRAHVDRELPEGVLASQGEVLASLELIPVDYDFAAGMYRLLEGRIAGFYEPEDATMYLVSDLSEAEAEETLAHELVHALQDQSYSLGRLLKFTAGDGDRLAAVHALVEGDATSAMFDAVAGSAFAIDEAVLRRLVAASTALSSVGDTPRLLQESLGAPYTDGFAFVQSLRRKGGWPAVDEVWRAPPESTEQLLHPEKLAAREPAVAVAVPPIAALGPGFRAVFDDILGEQGLRIAFEEYAPRDLALAAAAGWGGDRLVLARRDDPEDPGRRAFALAFRLRFDTAADASEAARVLARRFGKACRMRAELGPVAWAARGRDVALVAGPYERRSGGGAGAAGSCAGARAWLAEVVRAPLLAESPR
jgi:hypothetical protein